MTRYFRGSRESVVKGVTDASYIAVGDKSRGEGVHENFPAGELGVTHRQGTATPVFNNGTDPKRGMSSQFSVLANATGFDAEHIEKVHESEPHNSVLRSVLNDMTDSDFESARYDLHDTHTLAKKRGGAINPYAEGALKEQRQRGIGLAKDVSFVKNHPRMNPHQLFTTTEPSLHIHLADFDPSISSSFPSAVALAVNDFGTRNIVASNDLSVHSSKLARHAAKKGLVKGDKDNADMRITNGMDFSTKKIGVSDIQHVIDNGGGKAVVGGWIHQLTPVSQEDTQKARTTMREMLRGDKKPERLSSQFDQPTLPGMEKFV